MIYKCVCGNGAVCIGQWARDCKIHCEKCQGHFKFYRASEAPEDGERGDQYFLSSEQSSAGYQGKVVAAQEMLREALAKLNERYYPQWEAKVSSTNSKKGLYEAVFVDEDGKCLLSLPSFYQRTRGMSLAESADMVRQYFPTTVNDGVDREIPVVLQILGVSDEEIIALVDSYQSARKLARRDLEQEHVQLEPLLNASMRERIEWLIDAVKLEARRIFAATGGPDGSESDYAHLAGFGITEEDDNRFLDIEQYVSTGDADFDVDEDQLAEIRAFLARPASMVDFLQDLLTRYRNTNSVEARR